MRKLFVVLICLLTLYAPLELSRLIVAYGLDGELVVELVLIWVLYTAGMTITYQVIKAV